MLYSMIYRYQPAFSCILGGVEASGLSIMAHREAESTATDDNDATVAVSATVAAHHHDPSSVDAHG